MTWRIGFTILFIAAAIMAVIVLNCVGLGDWHQHEISRPRRDINGDPISGLVMRRRLSDGSWEYREMTEDERIEWDDIRAW